MYRLISHSKPPPPGYFKIWVRPRGGEVEFSCGNLGEGYFGIAQTQISDVVREVMAFIKENNLKAIDPSTIADLVDQLSCQRLGNSSEWCYDTDQPNPRTAAVVSGKRGCCGASL